MSGLSPEAAVGTDERFPSLPAELFPKKLDHCLESIGGVNFVEVLFHYWSISNCFEANDDYKRAQLLAHARSDEYKSYFWEVLSFCTILVL